jgi:hypothetical protein
MSGLAGASWHDIFVQLAVGDVTCEKRRLRKFFGLGVESQSLTGNSGMAVR